MNVEEFGYFIEIFMLLTVLNDLRGRGTKVLSSFRVHPALAHTMGLPGLVSSYTLGGDCGNNFLLAPNELDNSQNTQPSLKLKRNVHEPRLGLCSA